MEAWLGVPCGGLVSAARAGASGSGTGTVAAAQRCRDGLPPALLPPPVAGGSAVHPLPPLLSQKPELKPERVAAQKAIDGALVPVIKKTPLMDGYLKTLFSLSKADVPHKMKF